MPITFRQEMDRTPLTCMVLMTPFTMESMGFQEIAMGGYIPC